MLMRRNPSLSKVSSSRPSTLVPFISLLLSGFMETYLKQEKNQHTNYHLKEGSNSFFFKQSRSLNSAGQHSSTGLEQRRFWIFFFSSFEDYLPLSLTVKNSHSQFIQLHDGGDPLHFHFHTKTYFLKKQL